MHRVAQAIIRLRAVVVRVAVEIGVQRMHRACIHGLHRGRAHEGQSMHIIVHVHGFGVHCRQTVRIHCVHRIGIHGSHSVVTLSSLVVGIPFLQVLVLLPTST